MAKKFSVIADRAKAEWSDNARAVYSAAQSAFEIEGAEHAEIGRALMESRTAQHLTQEKLSELSGIQQAEISRIEKGAANPTVTTISRLATAMGKRLALV